MALAWNAPRPLEFWDPYLDWGRITDPRPSQTPKFEAIFLRLKGLERSAARQQLRQLIDDTQSDYLMPEQDYSDLVARIENAADPLDLPDEYFAYRKLGTPYSDHAHLFEVIDVGPASPITPPHGNSNPDQSSQPVPEWAKGQPIVAVIDDGIGFLNARFRRQNPKNGKNSSRFQAVWLQAQETLTGHNDKTVQSGTILSHSDINRMMRTPIVDESALYNELNKSLSGTTDHRSVEFSASHGTSILDIAGGADPLNKKDPARNWPLLAVQLPAMAVEDTSGTQFENYLVQGLRWILQQARTIDPSSAVIVNISLGMLAGPKDGTRFAEYQITKEAEAWQTLTGQPVRIVWAFGNNRRSRQVAQLAMSEQIEAAGIDWRVQPDDLTPSYVELRSAQSTADFDISLTDPNGYSSGFDSIPEGSVRTLVSDIGPVARIYHVPARKLDETTVAKPYYAIALCATGDLAVGAPQANSGRWTISTKTKSGSPVDVTLQIQRGDSLPEFRQRGRQSYFDSPQAWAWDGDMLDNTGLAQNSSIKRTGTHTALTTATSRQVFTVGATRLSNGGRKVSPAYYSAEGSDWSVESPTLSTVAEDGSALRGVLASGTYTGSIRPINGTSAAAARLTRSLALSHSKIKTNGPAHVDDLDDTQVHWTAVPSNMRSRLGQVTLSPGTETRKRRA